MASKTLNPFDSIESTYEYLDMLASSIEEVRSDVDAQIDLADSEDAIRRKKALQVVAYKLKTLETHVTKSRRILNDLKLLRRILAGEPRPPSVETTGET